MKTIIQSIAILSLTVFFSIKIMAQTDEQKGLELAQKVQNNISGFKKYSAEMEMTLTKENGKSVVRKIKTFHKEEKDGGERVISIFEDPADVKGTKMYSQPDDQTFSEDQWLFLPALGKTKRIANENKSGPFMGSEMAFEDLATGKLKKFQYKYAGTKTKNGKEYLILIMSPISKYSGYHHIESWIEKDRLIPAFSNYYDRKNELVKTQEEELKKMGSFYLTTKIKVHNHKTNRETTVVWSGFNFNTKLDETAFNPNNFERIK